MAFKSEPIFENGYEQLAKDAPLNRARLKRLFKVTKRECELAFADGLSDATLIANRVVAKAPKGILLTIAIAVAIELIKLWIQKLWAEYNR